MIGCFRLRAKRHEVSPFKDAKRSFARSFMRKNQMALNLFTKFSAIFIYFFMRLMVKLPVSTSLRWQWGHSFSMMPV